MGGNQQPGAANSARLVEGMLVEACEREASEHPLPQRLRVVARVVLRLLVVAGASASDSEEALFVRCGTGTGNARR